MSLTDYRPDFQTSILIDFYVSVFIVFIFFLYFYINRYVRHAD